MKVLIISTNTLPAAPLGPVYIAGAVRQAGHDVQVYERLFATHLADELAAKLEDFQPDVVGISIRLVFGDEIDPAAPLGTRHTDLRPRVNGDRRNRPPEFTCPDCPGRTRLQLLCS